MFFLWRDNSIIFSATIHRYISFAQFLQQVSKIVWNFQDIFENIHQSNFDKTFIKIALMNCFQSIKKIIGPSDGGMIRQPSHRPIEDCRISKCIALKLSIFFYKPNETIYSSFRASYTSSCLSPCWMDHRSTARS